MYFLSSGLALAMFVVSVDIVLEFLHIVVGASPFDIGVLSLPLLTPVVVVACVWTSCRNHSVRNRWRGDYLLCTDEARS